MRISSFRAWLRCRNEQVAVDSATERGCSYGFCICDGLYYVGDADELAKGPILYIKTPAQSGDSA